MTDSDLLELVEQLLNSPNYQAEINLKKQPMNHVFHKLIHELLPKPELETEYLQAATENTIRVYSTEEHRRLDNECRSFLLHLEHIGLLSSIHRELVIEKIMFSDNTYLVLEELKWIILEILAHNASEVDTVFLEEVIFHDSPQMLH